jgi:hypothetical protein
MWSRCHHPGTATLAYKERWLGAERFEKISDFFDDAGLEEAFGAMHAAMLGKYHEGRRYGSVQCQADDCFHRSNCCWMTS